MTNFEVQQPVYERKKTENIRRCRKNATGIRIKKGNGNIKRRSFEQNSRQSAEQLSQKTRQKFLTKNVELGAQKKIDGEKKRSIEQLILLQYYGLQEMALPLVFRRPRKLSNKHQPSQLGLLEK